MNQLYLIFPHDRQNTINLEDFYRNFHYKISTDGYSSVLSMFDQNARCKFNNDIEVNPYNFLLKITSQGVFKLSYLNIDISSTIINEGLLINSISTVYPINFQGYCGNLVKINEVFIIKNINGNNLISNYMLKIFN